MIIAVPDVRSSHYARIISKLGFAPMPTGVGAFLLSKAFSESRIVGRISKFDFLSRYVRFAHRRLRLTVSQPTKVKEVPI